MKTIIRLLGLIAFVPIIFIAEVKNGWSSSIVWNLNPVTGDIIRVDPRTGTVLGSFAAPIKPVQGDIRAGLTIAEKGNTLLYQLGNNGPGPGIPERDILYGLDPDTGAVKSRTKGLPTGFGPDGISWEAQGGSTFTFFNHANPIPDIERFENIGTPEEQRTIFWGPTQYPSFNHSVGGLGGDGNGREFGVFLDVNNQFGGHRFIGEFDPFVNDSNFINTFIAPVDNIVGLAFDGRYLYAQDMLGVLFTLNPDTGEIANSVQLPKLFFPDGSPAPYRFDIAAAIPEPGSIILVIAGIITIATVKRISKRTENEWYNYREL